VTDDNFARNRNWEPILDRLIELREREKFKIRLILQVDTLCHRIPGFRRIMARVVADPASRSYIDEALRPYAGRNAQDHLVEMFADKISKTHGAPVQVAV
jgi:hypothetical protein